MIYIPLHTPQNTSNLGHNNSATKNSINNTQPPPRNTTVFFDTATGAYTKKAHNTITFQRSFIFRQHVALHGRNQGASFAAFPPLFYTTRNHLYYDLNPPLT
mmetsp:Transcript_2857/g.4820  ORF Transcript_2857/g.4820 Transcript_2857/m.4820 type:complete len:102 (-) Transcript_2857:1913-2218(-)